MTTRSLHLAKDLTLPLDAVTQKLAWLGVTGSGKTYGASKLAELLWQVGAQFVVLDPVGVWYGLRLAKDGKKPSAITIPIFGGLHGDVPLEATAGAVLANLVVDETLSAIIDVSQFESDADKARFARDFADRFFFRKKAAPSAVHFFLEECQEFVPQNPQKGEERMLHAFIRMQKLGRNFGIGSSYISQRPQEVNKKALNMAQTLFVFRTTGTHERKAIESWIADKSLDQDIANDLPKIETGHCHVWSPEFLKISETAHILEKQTFNASATPEVGATAKARELAPIDLDKVRSDMAATIEKAKADDPRELRKAIGEKDRRIKELEKATSGFSTSNEKAKPEVKRVEVLTDADRALLSKLAAAVADRTTKASELVAAAESRADRLVQTAVAEYLNTTRNVALETARELEQILERIGVQKVFAKVQPIAGRREEPTSRMPPPSPGRHGESRTASGSTAPRPPRSAPPASSNGHGELGAGGLRRILTALAQRNGLSDRQVALRAAMAKGGGTFRTYLSQGRANGWIVGDRSRLEITPAGVTALGTYDPLPEGRDLQEYWLRELGNSGAAEMLRALCAAYPKALTKEQLGEATNMAVGGGTFRTYLSKLRTLELIDGRGDQITASEELFS